MYPYWSHITQILEAQPQRSIWPNNNSNKLLFLTKTHYQIRKLLEKLHLLILTTHMLFQILIVHNIQLEQWLINNLNQFKKPKVQHLWIQSTLIYPQHNQPNKKHHYLNIERNYEIRIQMLNFLLKCTMNNGIDSKIFWNLHQN